MVALHGAFGVSDKRESRKRGWIGVVQGKKVDLREKKG